MLTHPAFAQEVSVLLGKRWKEAISELNIEIPLTELCDLSLQFLQPGKRTRANLARLGYQAVQSRPATPSPALCELACALEFYQASALVHDDIIDRSQLRRGLPTLHRSFSQFFSQQRTQAPTSPQHFGTGAAILLGDLYFSLANQCATQAAFLAGSDNPAFPANDFLQAFTAMTKEVALGQYLDFRLESLRQQDPGYHADNCAEEQILQIYRHKSAHYSVAFPLLLGAYLGQTQDLAEQRQALFEIGTSWGIAFQLADDDLDTFGCSELTGKAPGLDWRDGKLTLLWALASKTCTAPAEKQLLSEVFGNQAASSQQIQQLIALLESSGVHAQHQAKIAHFCAQGERLLAQAPLPARGKAQLAELGHALGHRQS